MRYAHTLLFVCPECDLPVSISKISQEKNLEVIDGMRVRVRCDYCDYTSELIALTAKTHWVTEWEDATELAAKRPEG
jgi:hypothetical protein